jgi:triosephosphate isomerase
MGNRRTLIAGNWKMFKTGTQAVDFSRKLKSAVSDIHDVDVMVAPPFTALCLVSESLKGSSIQVGGQDLFWETQGAYTGEISAQMLKEAGCRYVIIGHSERRQYFGETNETVNRKVKAALAAGLIPVVCVGESDSQREAGKTFHVVGTQLSEGLSGIGPDSMETMLIAYEPIWAIGTGKTATNDQAQEVHRFIRDWIEKEGGNSIAKKFRILYGGSVKPGNIAGLIAMDDIDGALVGGASLDVDSFSGIIRPCSASSGK